VKIELDRQDVLNLLGALDAVSVSGRDNMIGALRLMAKLEGALKEEKDVENSEPADGGHSEGA